MIIAFLAWHVAGHAAMTTDVGLQLCCFAIGRNEYHDTSATFGPAQDRDPDPVFAAQRAQTTHRPVLAAEEEGMDGDVGSRASASHANNARMRMGNR